MAWRPVVMGRVGEPESVCREMVYFFSVFVNALTFIPVLVWLVYLNGYGISIPWVFISVGGHTVLHISMCLGVSLLYHFLISDIPVYHIFTCYVTGCIYIPMYVSVDLLYPSKAFIFLPVITGLASNYISWNLGSSTDVSEIKGLRNIFIVVVSMYSILHVYGRVLVPYLVGSMSPTTSPVTSPTASG
jgi:hypothetical protein